MEVSVKQYLAGIAFVVACSLLAPTARAQDPGHAQGGRPGRFGGGLILGVPLGDFGDLVDFSVGLMLDLDYAITPDLSITGRLGYIYHDIDGSGVSLSTVPLWAGVKYFFAPPGSARPFVAAELGLDYNRIDIEGLGHDSEVDAAMTLGGGFELDALSIRAFFAFINLDEAGDSMELMASVSYYFLEF
jgi:hypothetical protein